MKLRTYDAKYERTFIHELSTHLYFNHPHFIFECNNNREDVCVNTFFARTGRKKLEPQQFLK